VAARNDEAALVELLLQATGRKKEQRKALLAATTWSGKTAVEVAREAGADEAMRTLRDYR